MRKKVQYPDRARLATGHGGATLRNAMVRLVFAGSLFCLVAIPAAAQSKDGATLSARLQKFEDKEEIQTLLLRRDQVALNPVETGDSETLPVVKHRGNADKKHGEPHKQCPDSCAKS